MSWKRTALLPIVLAVASCAVDGGSRGSGIATAQGNVDNVQTAGVRAPHPGRFEAIRVALEHFLRIEEVASARAALEGIQVTVEGSGATDTTDANGLFFVQGSFEGPVSLLFERADDGLSARVAVNIPAGGTLTLNNVRIDNSRGQATAQSRGVDFEGRITSTDCTGETITLVSSRRSALDADTYTVRLDTSVLKDRRGNLINCQDLRVGARTRVTGSVNDDGTFGDAVVQELD